MSYDLPAEEYACQVHAALRQHPLLYAVYQHFELFVVPDTTVPQLATYFGVSDRAMSLCVDYLLGLGFLRVADGAYKLESARATEATLTALRDGRRLAHVIASVAS